MSAIKSVLVSLLTLIFIAVPALAYANMVELKGMGRFDGWRDNSLIGYGLVVGLSGTGDSRRSNVTRQTLQNVLSRLGVTVTEEDINSRNVAIVMVAGKLPASANVGDTISITVSSAGDARSLAGGMLMMTPLMGPDRRQYALAQGPLVTGGYKFESESNFQQRNYPTTARLEQGATVERPVQAKLLKNDELKFLLHEPSFSTARDVAIAINKRYGQGIAWAENADEVRIKYDRPPRALTRFVADIQDLKVRPDNKARVVINERNGTIVAGGDVKISNVVVSQGDIRVTVRAENFASQPSYIAGFNPDISSLIVRNTDMRVEDGLDDVVATFDNSTVADLIQGLSKAGLDTRGIIGVLQAMKDAGALHAEIIVQ